MLKALEKCRKLRILDLQDNTFTEKGAIALANAIPHWPLLEQLNVGDCYLTSKGFRHLVPVLRDSAPALKELNLQYNELNVAAMESLLAAVRAMKLKRLEINGNCGGDLVEEFSEVLGDEVLGSVSDMEEEESDEDEDQSEDQSEEESEKEQEEAEIDELGAAMSRVNV